MRSPDHLCQKHPGTIFGTRGERCVAQRGCAHISGRERPMPTSPGGGAWGTGLAGLVYRESSARMVPRLRSITVGTEIWLMARSGSLNPWPVRPHTTFDPSGTPVFMSPATEAAEAASQNTDSCWAKKV